MPADTHPDPTAEQIAEAKRLMVDLSLFANGAYVLATRLAAAELQGIRRAATVNGSTPYPLLDVLRILCEVADHTLDTHSCDHHGYEVWSEARHAGRECIRELMRLAAEGGPLEAPLDNEDEPLAKREIGPGHRAFLLDLRGTIDLALLCANKEAYPGHGWRRIAAGQIALIDTVLKGDK